jgi:hypothetical protein
MNAAKKGQLPAYYDSPFSLLKQGISPQGETIYIDRREDRRNRMIP